jgi:hypothetical protein
MAVTVIPAVASNSVMPTVNPATLHPVPPGGMIIAAPLRTGPSSSAPVQFGYPS